MASAAEERIRVKVERMMRAYWPEGRIIHELQCGQGEHRLDLACVTPDRVVLAEIKSERDVLTRAEKQLGKAVQVSNEVWFCVAGQHEDKVLAAKKAWRRRVWEVEEEDAAEARFYYGVKLYVERSVEPQFDLNPTFKAASLWAYDLSPDPYQMWDLLWQSEQAYALGLHFGGATLPGKDARLSRSKMGRLAVEHMSGRELRRAVCMMLRARHFPRADAPIELESLHAPA